MHISTFRRQMLAGAALLAIGGGAGFAAGHGTRPAIEMAPLRAVAIRSLPGQTGIVSIRAKVAETFGDRVVLDDGSARTLVDLGREGTRAGRPAVGQTVTVQGRVDDGTLHPSFLVDAAGTVQALGPAGGPPDGHRGPPPPDRAGPASDAALPPR